MGVQLEVRSRLLPLHTSDSGCPSPLGLLNHHFWVFLLQNLIPFPSIMFLQCLLISSPPDLSPSCSSWLASLLGVLRRG